MAQRIRRCARHPSSGGKSAVSRQPGAARPRDLPPGTRLVPKSGIDALFNARGPNGWTEFARQYGPKAGWRFLKCCSPPIGWTRSSITKRIVAACAARVDTPGSIATAVAGDSRRGSSTGWRKLGAFSWVFDDAQTTRASPIHYSREPVRTIVCGDCAPSTILTNVFAGISRNRWTAPFGHRTSTESTFVRVPSPKCSRASLCDR